MKKIVISGYYGFNNVGDEAILYAILESIKKWQEDVHITVLSKDPKSTSQNYGVFAAPRWPLRRVQKELRDCDLFLTGGGGLLQDKTGPKSIPYYLGLMRIARKYGARTALFASGIGPVKTSIWRFFIRQQLEKLDFLSVRDEQSKELLEKWGVKKEIEVIPDPVFLLDPVRETGGEADLIREGAVGEGPRIIVAPRSSPGEKELDPAPWVELCRRLQIEQGAQVILWALHGEEDGELCSEIKAKVDGVIRLEANYTIDRFLEVLQAADLLIGVRLHSLILGGVAGCPLLGISYDPKVEALLSMLDLPRDINLDSFSPSAVSLRAGRILDQASRYKTAQEERVVNLREKARQGIDLLEEFVRREIDE